MSGASHTILTWSRTT